MYSGLGYSSYHIGEPSLISKLLLPCVYDTMTSRMQASGERSPALHRRPRTRSKLLTLGIAHTFNSGGISHWADIKIHVETFRTFTARRTA